MTPSVMEWMVLHSTPIKPSIPPTREQRIVQWLRENPGQTSKHLAEDFGWKPATASSFLSEIMKTGKVRRDKISQFEYRYYAEGE